MTDCRFHANERNIGSTLWWYLSDDRPTPHNKPVSLLLWQLKRFFSHKKWELFSVKAFIYIYNNNNIILVYYYLSNRPIDGTVESNASSINFSVHVLFPSRKPISTHEILYLFLAVALIHVISHAFD